MSQWTHVAACIRVDCPRAILPPKMTSPERLGELLLPGLPSGSEGALELVVWENPCETHLAAFTVTVFGDLRDFGLRDVATIEAWLSQVGRLLTPHRNIPGDFPGYVRNAIVEVVVEFHGEKVWRWDGEAGAWVVILNTLLSMEEKKGEGE